ncbi:MAG: 1-acyl-sn-glycerol-3-phosphate acyltransferase [Bdellovibrionales bacterium]|nr:1-acyl-sn-glycerol-3-phosphate acyltransferase [Bdellovibrionales bacterium]
MRPIFAIVKITSVLFFIVVFLMLSGGLGLMISSRWKLTKYRSYLISFFLFFCRFILGIKTQFKGESLDASSHLYVSNHLSYLDILVLSSQIPSSYVTSVEIKETPFLGAIVRAAGCLFVERRDKSNLENEISELTEALANGLNVTIFPEATSTNGDQVLRFRRPLYNAAIKSKKNVVPLCINYQSIDKKPIDTLNRDHVFWYGSMSFLPHLWSVSLHRKIDVDVTVLDAIMPTPKITAQHLSEISHQKVSSTYKAPRLVTQNHSHGIFKEEFI